MRLADMHIHTTFSPDGKSSMEEQCKKTHRDWDSNYLFYGSCRFQFF